MSLHWTLIAGFLYAEIVFILLLLIPFVSNVRWNRLFKSRFLKGLENQLIYYFYIVVAILVLFFLDAVREMRKYSDESMATEGHGHGGHLDAQMQMQMRLFRAQRNFYISGFALFLCLVIRRLVGLIAVSATLEAEKEAAMRQAASASRAAESLMDGGDASGKGDAKNIKEMEKELKQAKEELSKAVKDKDSMKSQAENLAQEYDRVSSERNQLEKKLRIAGGGGSDGDKKDD
jgi:B-cell receptor-associated protein 31